MLEASRPGVGKSLGNLDPEERSFLRTLFRRGLAIRVAVALFLAWSGYSVLLAPDEATYYSDGHDMALYWAGVTFARPWRFDLPIPLGYFYMNAASCYLADSDIPLRLLNALVGAYCGRYAYLLAREVFNQAVARRTATLYTMLPSLILWSALNIRDIWVVALVLYVSWKSLEVAKSYSHLGLISALGGIWALTLFRDYLFYVVALPPIAAFLIGRRGELGRNFLLALAATGAIVFFVQHGAASSAEHHMSLETLSQTRQNLVGGGSAFGGNVDISTPEKALSFLPIGIAYFLFSPFPWQINSPLKLLSLPEMLLIYFLTPAMFRGIRFGISKRFRDALQSLLLMTALTISYALGEGNVGTLYRHRAQAITFYLMFAAAGIEAKRSGDVARAA
jgi:Dolichyl-phosphate-mannose-protein mannosyltransferase